MAADPLVADDQASGPLRYTRADRAIMALAARQHGIVSRAQVLGIGVSAGALGRRVGSPLMRVLHRGVYLVGPILLPQGRAMAAVLACGPVARVSHDSASALWRCLSDRNGFRPRREITPSIDGSDTVHVTVTRGDHRRRGIRLHRVRSLLPDEVTTLENIPITTPARTLLDLAASLPSRDLERALVESLANRRTSRDEILILTDRHPRHAGAVRLRALLEAGEPAHTRSEAEDRFLALVRDVRLPRPEVNVTIEASKWTACGGPQGSSWRWTARPFTPQRDGVPPTSGATPRSPPRAIAPSGSGGIS